MHLLVEEINHLLFTEPKGDIAHLKSKFNIGFVILDSHKSFWLGESRKIQPRLQQPKNKYGHSDNLENMQVKFYLWRIRYHCCRDLTSCLKFKPFSSSFIHKIIYSYKAKLLGK